MFSLLCLLEVTVRVQQQQQKQQQWCMASTPKSDAPFRKRESILVDIVPCSSKQGKQQQYDYVRHTNSRATSICTRWGLKTCLRHDLGTISYIPLVPLVLYCWYGGG